MSSAAGRKQGTESGSVLPGANGGALTVQGTPLLSVLADRPRAPPSGDGTTSWLGR